MTLARALAPRAAAFAIAIGATVTAWRVGGGADPPAPPPRRELDAGAGAPARLGDTYEAAIRLVDVAKDARFEMQESAAFRAVMRAQWRQLKPPFVPLTGDAVRFVSSVALRASAGETQWAMPVGTDSTPWAPDARIWNMNEGSFDMRESLVSTTPGAISFKVNVPQGAKLSFAAGTVNATEDATAFVVAVVDASGRRHDACRHVVEPSGARHWTDASCDLSAFAGQDVELTLSAAVAPRTEPADAGRAAQAVVAEIEYAGPGNGKATIDGGVVYEEALAKPSSAVALWANPTILARTAPRAPYNVVWVVVDALRPDVVASFHDDDEDAKKNAAKTPPLEALLPKVPGITPAIDELARRGARFTRAYSAGCWTRPGTLAMLAGARSSELGIETTEWVVPQPHIQRFYSADPPLLSLLLRRQGVVTRAFVNNYFMAGYAPIGIDMGFERVADHRYRTRDTLEITRDATSFIKANKDTRFFAFVNYNSPHEPYEPPAKHLARVPPPPSGPLDDIVRLYMAEAAKDDEAIGVLMRAIDDAGLREKTIVVVTADHGETLSSSHTGTSGLDNTPIRYHHSASNFEETTKVPIVIVAPGIAAGTAVKVPVRTIDLAPTVLDLLGLEPHPKMSGKSLVGLAHGEKEADERVVVSEGRGSRSIIAGRWRLVVREGRAQTVIQPEGTRTIPLELFDLVDDPGERWDVAKRHPEIVAEMKARLEAALKNVPVAGTAADAPLGAAPTLHLRFAGGAKLRRVSGTIHLGRAAHRDVTPVELGRDALKVDGEKIDVAFRTSPDVAVGFDIVVDPPTSPVTWQLWLDDKPWPIDGVFGGPYGLVSSALSGGVANDEGRRSAEATALPTIDARRDVGLFVTRDRRGGEAAAPEASGEGAEEMARLLREWGYAHGSSAWGASGAKK